MPKLRLKEKIVVVTGAASGIGAAISRRFGQEGATVVLLDMNEEDAGKHERELVKSGIDAVSMRCDVSIEKDCRSVIGRIINRFGGIDILVNNAGITQRSLFASTQLSVFRRVMEVNFFGSLNCTKFAIESIIERRGMIIVISSIAGIGPLLGRSGYCASKHALHGLFATLRTELRDSGVHVLIVCPGFTQTNLQKRALDGNGSVTSHPQSRIGSQTSPGSVADAVFRAIRKRKHLLVLTPVGRVSSLLSRLFPKLYESIMTRSLKEELMR